MISCIMCKGIRVYEGVLDDLTKSWVGALLYVRPELLY